MMLRSLIVQGKIDMRIILLSGGSGKRLWPLSNESRAKQFIKIFKNECGEYESMLQRVYRQICSINETVNITIATSKAQVASIHNQLGEDVGICVEPYRRGTFSAVALAASWLYDIQKVPLTEPIVVCPVDSYADNDFFKTVKMIGEATQEIESGLILLGIEPTYPSEKYGYMIPESDEKISRIIQYKEKPNVGMAKELIAQKALWNGGVFAFQLEYMLKKAKDIIGFSSYDDLYDKYEGLKDISLDYAIVEQEKNIWVMRFDGKWKDLGTWNTLTEVMDDACVGNAMLSKDCNNVHVINELDIPILCMGLENVVVSASPGGILASNKEQSSNLKPFVNQLDQKIMFADKSWGQFRVLDIADESITIKITIRSGCMMNYHSHENRDEIWTIISGKGRTIVDGMEQPVSAGDVIAMQAGCRHTIIADTELKLIEVQLGREISVHDKRKYEL